MEPRSGRFVLKVTLRKARLPGPSTTLNLTFRRPLTEVQFLSYLVFPSFSIAMAVQAEPAKSPQSCQGASLFNGPRCCDTRWLRRRAYNTDDTIEGIPVKDLQTFLRDFEKAQPDLVVHVHKEVRAQWEASVLATQYWVRFALCA